MSKYGLYSRQVELKGISKLKNHFGDTAKIEDLGHTSEHDFEIHYADGRKAIGEFSSLVEPLHRAMWNAIFKRSEPMQIKLPSGFGFWSLTLNKPTNINALESLAPAWIMEMIATSMEEIHLYNNWPNTEFARRLRDHGISRIRKVSEQIDSIYFMVSGHGGVVPSDLYPLRDTLEILLKTNKKVRSNCEKLLRKESDEKHVYLQCGELIPELSIWALWMDRDPVEIPELELPNEITHLWLDPASDRIRSILWEREKAPIYF